MIISGSIRPSSKISDGSPTFLMSTGVAIVSRFRTGSVGIAGDEQQGEDPAEAVAEQADLVLARHSQRGVERIAHVAVDVGLEGVLRVLGVGHTPVE